MECIFDTMELIISERQTDCYSKGEKEKKNNATEISFVFNQTENTMQVKCLFVFCACKIFRWFFIEYGKHESNFHICGHHLSTYIHTPMSSICWRCRFIDSSLCVWCIKLLFLLRDYCYSSFPNI